MTNIRYIAIFFLIVQVAFADHKEEKDSAEQLKTLITALELRLEKFKLEYNTAEVIPRRRDRDDFEEDLDNIVKFLKSDPDGFSSLVKKLKGQVNDPEEMAGLSATDCLSEYEGPTILAVSSLNRKEFCDLFLVRFLPFLQVSGISKLLQMPSNADVTIHVGATGSAVYLDQKKRRLEIPVKLDRETEARIEAEVSALYPQLPRGVVRVGRKLFYLAPEKASGFQPYTRSTNLSLDFTSNWRLASKSELESAREILLTPENGWNVHELTKVIVSDKSQASGGRTVTTINMATGDRLYYEIYTDFRYIAVGEDSWRPTHDLLQRKVVRDGRENEGYVTNLFSRQSMTLAQAKTFCAEKGFTLTPGTLELQYFSDGNEFKNLMPEVWKRMENKPVWFTMNNNTEFYSMIMTTGMVTYEKRRTAENSAAELAGVICAQNSY